MSPKAVEQLLDRKLDVCFGHFDQNGDGVLEPADALVLAARIVAFLGERFSSPKAQAVFVAFETFWDSLSEKLDANHDGKVSPLAWRENLKRAFADDLESFNASFGPVSEALWSICDKDGDGRVGADEFSGFHKAFGTTPENSRIAFGKLDRDGDGSLSVDELLTAWQEYYTSTDPTARGNWLYGGIFVDDIWEGATVSR